MSEGGNSRWEERVRSAANSFPYPITPDIAGDVGRRLTVGSSRRTRGWERLARVTAVVLLLLAGLLAVPPVRAAVLNFLRIGSVEVRRFPPAPAARTAFTEPTASIGASSTESPAATHTAQATAAVPTATPLRSALDVGGETTLAEARRLLPFAIRLPSYPADLGMPNRVFLLPTGFSSVALVWTDRNDPDEVRYALYEMTEPIYAEKMAQDVRQTKVNGRKAAWATGPTLLRIFGPDEESIRWVDENVLIWTEGEITYRLETDGTLQEAIRIAESIR